MGISEDELKELISHPKANIEKLTTLSDDGKSILTRVPKEIVSFLKLKKGDKFKWLVDAKNGEILLEVYDVSKKKKVN